MTEPATAVDESPAEPEVPRLPRFDILLDTVTSVAGTVIGVLAAAGVVLLAVVFIASGNLSDALEQDQFQDRVDAVNAVYRQGEHAREALGKSGTALTSEAMCEDAFHRVGADEERITRYAKDNKPDTAFAELRKLSFINGCLGRPNSLPATPLPAASQGQ